LQRYLCALGLITEHGITRPEDMGGPLPKTVVDAGVPVLVPFAMVVVGMEITTDLTRRFARRPGSS
jgi:hypothetical protein